MYHNFQTKLISLADDKYREFCMRGIPCDRPFLGVRIPQIRKLVKEITPEHLEEFIKAEPLAIEEIIARGFAVARLPYEDMLKYFDSHVKILDNWCTVDTFCAALRKTIKNHKEDFLDKKVENLLAAKNEFAVRTGLVCLLNFYVKPKYLHLIFDHIESLKKREEYYIKMAIAWLLAECFIKCPEITRDYLEHSKLGKWTFNKTISKICDSYRVDQDIKKEIKKLRR